MKTSLKELFVTNVGSHMWSMERPDSDLDLFVCYLVPSEDFLLGKRHIGGHHSIKNEVVSYTNHQPTPNNPLKIMEVDRQSFELGHVVNQLLKNNFNFVVGVLSPIVLKDCGEFKELRYLTNLNLSKQIYHSIHGLAMHNYKKYIVSGKDRGKKRCALVVRVLKFGCRFLATHEIKFDPVVDAKPHDVSLWMNALDYFYGISTLPNKPQYETLIHNWLLGIRLRHLIPDKV